MIRPMRKPLRDVDCRGDDREIISDVVVAFMHSLPDRSVVFETPRQFKQTAVMLLESLDEEVRLR